MNLEFSVVRNARNLIVRLSIYLKIKLGILSSPRIVPFIGYSNGTITFITGEVLEDIGISKPIEGQSRWKNLKSMIKRYLADEFAGVRVQVIFLGQTQEVKTNKYGVFNARFRHDAEEIEDVIWQKVYFRLNEIVHPKQINDAKTEGEVMIIKRRPQFGIISDVDDTILVSYATAKLMKFRLMFFNNALTRMPFEGVSAFYHSLQRGSGDGTLNPVFYLSNSEWDLYDLIYEFIDFNRIPKGPLLLREMAIRVLRIWKMREYNKNHKLEKLRHLLTVFHDLNFILIGDSGQKDPEVYSKITQEFPERIMSVYIRDIGIKRNNMRIQTLSQQLFNEFQTEMILVKDTETAAKHALSKGYILKEEIPGIRREKIKDAEMIDAKN